MDGLRLSKTSTHHINVFTLNNEGTTREICTMNMELQPVANPIISFFAIGGLINRTMPVHKVQEVILTINLHSMIPVETEIFCVDVFNKN